MYCGEVRFYFQLKIGESTRTLAILSRYTAPHGWLLSESYGTVWSCHALGDDGLAIIEVSDIQSCIAMIPHADLPCIEGYTSTPYFMMEKLGDDTELVGPDEPEDSDE